MDQSVLDNCRVTMSLKLYMTPLSPAVRAVLITAKALKLELETIPVDLSKGDNLKPAFLKLNPQHTVPVLDDKGFILADSHAIICYLVSKYGKDDSLYPKSLKERAIVDHRLHFDNGTLFARGAPIVKSVLREGATTVTDAQKAAVNEAYEIIETFLEQNQWIAGNSITIADYSIIASITSGNVLVPIDPVKYPKIISWINKMKALPEYEGNKGVELFEQIFTSLLKK